MDCSVLRFFVLLLLFFCIFLLTGKPQFKQIFSHKNTRCPVYEVSSLIVLFLCLACPAFVSLEASQDGVTTFPLCAPMNTSSLVYIKLQLQRPEVVTAITIRLHRARDSMTIGLSQILLMGYSAFGDVGYKTNNLFLPTEDFVSRSR